MGRTQSVSEARASMGCWRSDNSTYRGVARIVEGGVKEVAKVYIRSIVSDASPTKMTIVFSVEQEAFRTLSAADSIISSFP
jgi:hypothetical protein